MHIVIYKGRTYHVHSSGQIWCVYRHGRSMMASRKLNPTGRVAWAVRRQMAKEKGNG